MENKRMMNEYKKVRLGDVATQIRGVSYKPADIIDKDSDNSTIILRANNIYEDKINYDELVFVKSNRVSEEQYLLKGDILICASSGSKHLVGKAACFNDSRKVSFGAFCKVIRPEGIYFEYLKHYFFSPTYRQLISAVSEGANINNIRSEDLENLQIPLPPIEEQKQIAATLDKATKIIAENKKLLEKYDLLIKSQFIEMFGDPVLNEKGFEKVRLDTVADIKIGPFGSLLHQEDYIKNAHALVNPSHILDSKIVINPELTISDEKYEELKPYHLLKDDVVMGRRGEMGRCAVVTEDGLLCGTGSIIIRSKGYLKPDFLQKIISFPSYKKTIEDKAVGQTMPNLNVPIVSSFEIIKPPKDTQDAYYAFVQQIDKSKSAVQQSLEKCETLYKSLMQEYFG